MANSRSIPRRDRLIVALDVPSVNDARALVAKLGDEVAFYKLGLELFMSGGPSSLSTGSSRTASACSST